MEQAASTDLRSRTRCERAWYRRCGGQHHCGPSSARVREHAREHAPARWAHAGEFEGAEDEGTRTERDDGERQLGEQDQQDDDAEQSACELSQQGLCLGGTDGRRSCDCAGRDIGEAGRGEVMEIQKMVNIVLLRGRT